MIKSMTGFGRYETVSDRFKLSVEMKAVNHRYLDLSIKLPKKLNFFETGIRNLLKTYIQRGKVDIFISYEDYTENKLVLRYNQELAAEYVGYFSKMEKQFQIPNDISVSTLLHCGEVLTMEEVPQDEEQIWKLLSETLEGATKHLVESRIQEGENLKKDLLLKLEHMAALTNMIERRFPQVLDIYRKKLEFKVGELLHNSTIDDSRILTEVTLFADKIGIDEELVRLKSHIERTKAELLQGETIGRKLDFIAQEMNREANTILSKSNDLEITDGAIELKTEIEKIREQIQNIE